MCILRDCRFLKGVKEETGLSTIICKEVYERVLHCPVLDCKESWSGTSLISVQCMDMNLLWKNKLCSIFSLWACFVRVSGTYTSRCNMHIDLKYIWHFEPFEIHMGPIVCLKKVYVLRKFRYPNLQIYVIPGITVGRRAQVGKFRTLVLKLHTVNYIDKRSLK
jgi:hypothetical protein